MVKRVVRVGGMRLGGPNKQEGKSKAAEAEPSDPKKFYYFYVLENKDGKRYGGMTECEEARIAQHRSGRRNSWLGPGNHSLKFRDSRLCTLGDALVE